MSNKKLNLDFNKDVPTINWWLNESGVDFKQTDDDKWIGRCPAHDDHNPSLSLTRKEDGTALINCFAGCSYANIRDTASEGLVIDHDKGAEGNTIDGTCRVEDALPIGSTFSGSPKDWLADYTGVPRAFLDTLPIDEDHESVYFTHEGYQVRKKRIARTKSIAWVPSDVKPIPPLWPTPPESLSATIYLCEGETDTIVMRYLGFDAYAVTVGAGTKISRYYWRALQAAGCEHVVVMFDCDEAGSKGATALAEAAREAGL